MKKILVTGCAGFIGFHICKRHLLTKSNVIVIDNLNSYYDVAKFRFLITLYLSFIS